MPHPVLIPVRVGAHRLELPVEVLVGQPVRIRLPRSPITRVVDGVTVVVGDSGTDWLELVMHDPASCFTPLELDPEGEGPDAPHATTICPACIDSWSCDYEVELLLRVDGSGEG